MPEHSSFAECIACLATSVKQLQNGVEMLLGNERVWVVGGIGLLSGDFPQRKRSVVRCTCLTHFVCAEKSMNVV